MSISIAGYMLWSIAGTHRSGDSGPAGLRLYHLGSFVARDLYKQV